MTRDQELFRIQVGVIGPFDVAGVIGLCDGVLFRLMRSVTSTSSPTRKTAPDGPAQAYWPKTGLSMNMVRVFGGDQDELWEWGCLLGNFSLTLRSFANSP